MWLTRLLLNRPHPNSPDLLRFWQVDKPKALPIKKRTGKFRVHRPVLPEEVKTLRDQLDVEYNVMRCLSSPYITKEQEEAYNKKYGSDEDRIRQGEETKELERMPNKPKVVSGTYSYDKRRGNIGNLLHEPQTVERMFDRLLQQRKFE